MARPTSFRLPDDLLDRLDEEAASSGRSVTALVTSLLDEGIKTHHFPGIVYRDGPTGRRAALVSGPDVWEVVRAVSEAKGRGEARLHSVAEAHDLPLARARLAVEFYAAFPEEIDERIEADERAAERIREQIDRREQLLSS
jgi:hypothetical protein